MRQTSVFLNAAGSSPWVPINYLEIAFGVGIAVYPSSNANLTYTVQHTLDEIGPQAQRLALITQSASTTATITDTGPAGGFGHGVSVSDSILIGSSGTGIDSPNIGYSVVSVVSQTQYTVTTLVNQTATSQPGAFVIPLRVLNHASLNAQTARADGNYAFPVRAVRLLVTNYVAGYVVMDVLQGQGA